MADTAKHSIPSGDTANHEQSGVFNRDELLSFPPPVIDRKQAPLRLTSRVPYRVVVASDLSELSEAVFVEGIRFARARPPAELHVVTVVQRSGGMVRLPAGPIKQRYTPEAVQGLMEKSMRIALDQRKPQIEGLFDKIAAHVAIGDVASEILRLADDLLADLIVLGSRDYRGLHRRVWGSISKTVVSRANASVVLCRPEDFDHGEPLPMVAPPRADGGHTGGRHTIHLHDRSSITGGARSIRWGM